MSHPKPQPMVSPWRFSCSSLSAIPLSSDAQTTQLLRNLALDVRRTNNEDRSLQGGHTMATWNEFETDAPDIAAAGKQLLYQFGVGLAFLATLRKDGAPRLHPVCPTVV